MKDQQHNNQPTNYCKYHSTNLYNFTTGSTSSGTDKNNENESESESSGSQEGNENENSIYN